MSNFLISFLLKRDLDSYFWSLFHTLTYYYFSVQVEFISNKDYLDSFEPEDLLAYILLFYTSKQNKHIVKFDYSYYKKEEKSASVRLIFMLANILIPSKTIGELHGITFLKDIMGNELFDDFNEYSSHFHVI